MTTDHTTQPTLLPWTYQPRASGRGEVYSADIERGDYVAEVYNARDAAFIVQACNSHAALVAALVDLLTDMTPDRDGPTRKCQSCFGEGATVQTIVHSSDCHYAAGIRALATARGEI